MTASDDEATAEPREAPSRLKRVMRYAVPTAAVLAVATACAFLLGDTAPSTLVASGIIGALIVGGYYLFTALARHLGRLTAAAAISLIGASVMGFWAALAPTCPEASGPGRCTTAEIGTYALGGALMPLGYILLIGVPIVVVTTLWRFAKGARAVIQDRRANARANASAAATD